MLPENSVQLFVGVKSRDAKETEIRRNKKNLLLVTSKMNIRNHSQSSISLNSKTGSFKLRMRTHTRRGLSRRILRRIEAELRVPTSVD